MYDSNKGIYDMILGRYLWTELGLKLKWSEHVIESDNGILKGSTTPMVYLGIYIFKGLSKEKITPEESFKDAYVKEVYEL